MKNIHPTQKNILDLIKTNSEQSYTVRQLQEELHISSTSVVFHHLQQLEKKGFLKKDSFNNGNYQIITDNSSDNIYLNMYGMVQCGPNGRILDGNPLERMEFSKKFLGFDASDAFIVKAAGDSMMPKINEGDLVIAKKTNYAESGSIVVCVNEEKALIKKIEISNDNIYLISLNPNYKPFPASKENFIIEGIVKKVFSDI